MADSRRALLLSPLLETLCESYAATRPFIIVILAVGIWESLYGIFEFFSGHGQILNLEGEGLVPAVTGTFINRNYFAGYLLMVIPLSVVICYLVGLGE